MAMYVIGLFIYFFVLVISGIFLSRKNLDFDSYFYGSRKLGSFLIFFTVTASWFGAASTIATVEAAQKTGFQAVWLLGIPTVTTIIIFILLNKKIRETRFVSLPVLLEKYYGKIVSSFASFLIFIYMVLLAASQFVAWGKFIGGFLGQSYEITVITGAVVIILYSYLGGYISVVLTDGVQFLLLSLSLIYLMIFFNNTTPLFKPLDFDFFSNHQHNLLMTTSFTLAWVISPIIWQRIASAKSAKASKWGLFMSIAAFSILYFWVIRVGIYLRSIPGTTSGDVFGFVVENWLPAGGSLLVFLGIASAIMSTGDTAVNIGALTLVKDVFQIKRKNKVVFYAKIGTFISGILAAVVALRFDSIIKTLGLASEIMAEGLFIPGMYLLFFKKKRPLAALLSLVLGGGFSILVFVNAYGLSLPLPQWPYSLPYGLALSLTGFIIGYILDKK
jgi:SSS family solute:Na+ symporter